MTTMSGRKTPSRGGAGILLPQSDSAETVTKTVVRSSTPSLLKKKSKREGFSVVAPDGTNNDDAGTSNADETGTAAATAVAISGNNDTTSSTSVPAPRKKLKIDTAALRRSNSSASFMLTPTTPSTPAQDTHPFARGSVIEVWHIQKNVDADDEDDWWSEPDSSDEESVVNDTSTKRKRTIRLCDVIDRVPVVATASSLAISSNAASISNLNATPGDSTQAQQWKYYVHYRDFNRRMDEWITMDRIVSPPSIGNAKARQLKKEEERERRKQERLKQQAIQKQQHDMLLAAVNSAFGGNTSSAQQQQQLAQQQPGVDTANADGRITPSGPRRRRSTALLQLLANNVDAEQQLTDLLPVPGGGTTISAADTAASRRRRLSRRKTASFMDDADAATVTASNVSRRGTGGDGGYNTDNDLNLPGGGLDLNVSSHSTSTFSSSGGVNPSIPTAVSAGGYGSGGYSSNTTSNNHKKDVILGGADASNKFIVSTQTVGDHVIGTVQAVELDEHEGLDEASLREHEEVTKIKNVGFIELGRHQMETWYFSPLPKDLLMNTPQQQLQSQQQSGGTAYLDVLYVCEFTLRMFSRKIELQRFQDPSILPVHQRHPPGNEIYRKDNLSMFEIDGSEEKIYCQNLCYIAKLFLDHKTLYYDVDPFLFYVLCEVDERGYHIVGYFSKEKYSDVGYNLACILAFPAHQRKGYGRFLISFSYELSKKEEKVGSPEKPLSDLGQQAYKPYWASVIIDFLLYRSNESSLSIMDIAKRTSIMAEDIVFTLNQLGILKIINGIYLIVAQQKLLQKLASKYPIKEPRVDPTKIHWTPFITDVKRDKFSIHSKKSSIEMEE